jgi:hypothetical protein
MVKRREVYMAKRTKKNDAEQKNKQGFNSATMKEEFAQEFANPSKNNKNNRG